MSADLIRRGNRSKLAERSLLVIIDLLIGGEIHSFVLYMAFFGGGGGNFKSFIILTLTLLTRERRFNPSWKSFQIG